MVPTKPESVARSPYKSAKWDEVVEGRSFSESDVPALTLLVQWYQVVDTAMEDIEVDGEIRLVYSNDMGDVKPLPQIAQMKQASAEIRALNKQLGINDESSGGSEGGAGANIISFSARKRADRRARAANQG